MSATQPMDLPGAMRKGYYRIALHLAQSDPAALKRRDSEGRSPLIACVYVDETSWGTGLARAFLQHGARPGQQDKRGLTALHHAVLKERISLVTLFLSCLDYSPAAADDHGNRPIHYAADLGNAKILALLFETHTKYDIPTNMANKMGLTPLDLAQRLQHVQCVRLLSRANQQGPTTKSSTLSSAQQQSVRSSGKPSSILKMPRKLQNSERENTPVTTEQQVSQRENKELPHERGNAVISSAQPLSQQNNKQMRLLGEILRKCSAGGERDEQHCSLQKSKSLSTPDLANWDTCPGISNKRLRTTSMVAFKQSTLDLQQYSNYRNNHHELKTQSGSRREDIRREKERRRSHDNLAYMLHIYSHESLPPFRRSVQMKEHAGWKALVKREMEANAPPPPEDTSHHVNTVSPSRPPSSGSSRASALDMRSRGRKGKHNRLSSLPRTHNHSRVSFPTTGAPPQQPAVPVATSTSTGLLGSQVSVMMKLKSLSQRAKTKVESADALTPMGKRDRLVVSAV